MFHRPTFSPFAPRVLSAAIALALASSCLAQPSIHDLESQLAAVKQQLVSAAPASHFDLITRCDELERRLIAAAPADDRVPIWLADRAADALDMAALDAADLAVLFGVPTQSQSRAVRARAQDALDLAKRADQAASQSIARLEAQLVGGQARPDTVEQSLHTLIDIEQAQRIPYLKALATLLLGATAPLADEPTRDTAQSAAKLLGALPPPNPPTGPLAEARALALGAALIHSSIGLGDRSPDALKAAAAQFEPIARTYRTDAPDNASPLRARLGLLRAGRDLPVRPRSANAALEREMDTLEAESRAASFLDRAVREPTGRNLLLSSAITTLLAAANDVGPNSDALRIRAYEKIAAAIPADIAVERLPPEATLASAVARIRQAPATTPTSTGDATARQDAIALLDKLVKRSDASAALRCQARWERAVIIAAAGDPIDELDAVAAAFRADPTCEKVLPAARRTADLFAHQQANISPTADPLAALPEPWRIRLPALRDALTLLLARDPDNAPRWQRDAATLAIHDLSAPTDPAAIDRALALAETIGSASPAIAPLAEALWRAVDQRRIPAADATDRADAALARSQWQSLIPIATRTLAWSRKYDPAREPGYALLLGESFAGISDPQGLAILSGLSGGPIDRPDAALWPRFKLALARAQYHAGQSAQALAILREVSDHFEGEPGSAKRDPAYWSAWSEMITIQQSLNTDAARSPDIRVQIKRLELLDPKLGGSPWSDRIRHVRAAVGE